MRHLSSVKRVVLLLCSLGYAAGRMLLAGVCRVCGRQLRPVPVVLYYHGIAAQQRDAFAWQVRHAAALSRRDGSAGGSNRCRLVFTFDDAFDSVLEHALPLVRQYGLTCMIFVPTAYIGQPAGWLSPGGKRPGVMTAAQLRHCLEMGVLLGSHTHTHPRLSRLDDAALDRELCVSKRLLSQVCGRPVTQLAFPHGDYDARVVRRARAAGYVCLYGIVPGDQAGVRGRIVADPDDWQIEFYLKIRGAYAWFGRVSRLKHRLRRGERREERHG